MAAMVRSASGACAGPRACSPAAARSARQAAHLRRRCAPLSSQEPQPARRVAGLPLRAAVQGPQSGRSVAAGATLGADLKAACGEQWARCTTEDPFILAVRDGTIEDEQFNTWLLQDYLFVCAFTRFAGRVLAKAPDEAGLQLVLRSLCMLPDELDWFRTTLQARGIDTEAAAEQQANTEYRLAMERWAEELPWGEAILVYYAIEHVYNTAWQSCAERAEEPYRTWAGRWGSPEFSAFCSDLEAAAELALAGDGGGGEVPAEQRARALELFQEVLRLEEGFWAMAFQGEGSEV